RSPERRGHGYQDHRRPEVLRRPEHQAARGRAREAAEVEARARGDAPMSLGPPGFSVAFDDDALTDNPTWTRIDNVDGIRVTGITVDRGRADERSKTVPGTVTITGYDTVGATDPTNASGPWYGKLDPTKQAAVTIWNPVLDEWNYIFRGHTAEWIYELDVSEK